MVAHRGTRLLDAATALVRLEHELARHHAEFKRVASEEASASRAEALLVVAARVVHCENELQLHRREYERLLGDKTVEPGQTRETASLYRPLARASSLAHRVQSALDVSAHHLSAHAIAAQLAEPVESVRAALSKLIGRGSVERVTVGIYRSVATGHRRAAGEDD